jgi:hypothetical protein
LETPSKKQARPRCSPKTKEVTPKAKDVPKEKKDFMSMSKTPDGFCVEARGS